MQISIQLNIMRFIFSYLQMFHSSIYNSVEGLGAVHTLPCMLASPFL